MSDIIQLLPDSVANQIAAGEVVQRPASAVKELIENSIDAGASAIKLIIKDAGKSLIQVIDDGCGMSATDSRMSFERHATSKIRKAEDLFAIRTMGFRGEALASIAAVAQVELKTRRHEDEIGTQLIIEGSEVKSQEACSCSAGTSFAAKNLFFNIPARRNFLKSNPVEMRHIIDEFQRVALAHPSVFFSLHHDGQEVFHLPKGTLKQRIVHIFGNSYNERLVPMEEQTDIISIKGFIGKPENAKKTRGEQFFFVNNRFIKDAYLNHAVATAYEELLPNDSYPFYVLFINIDPIHIDINVHPTKTEIKFDNEKVIYAIIRSAVKRSLGQYNISPAIDFDAAPSSTALRDFVPSTANIKLPTITVNPDFNPFEQDNIRSGGSSFRQTSSPSLNMGNWEQLYKIVREDEGKKEVHTHPLFNLPEQETESPKYKINENQSFQIHNRYIISPIKSGFIVIDQQAAHERVLYERYLNSLDTHKANSQQSLFPQNLELSPADFELLKEMMDEIKALGFDIREFGRNSVVVDGVPSDVAGGNEALLLENLLENFKQNATILKLDKRDNLARSLAKNASLKAGTPLTKEEMTLLIDELFACQMPKVSVAGKPTFITIGLDELLKRFSS
ncbi:DNA mismatch repair endonuclease MutL [Solitalea canadensis]|uniref:DNA mismatch repair protein MutL n=1 Tax=Solitalea canadensis (strain ATCC 29591 / DSM 3403 / JCM 21819 / LMG 8368 / NBRC 15130 / NCIMB 12057 / USAM 9D) TaxID=929556 RepID=H8KMV0_SOLCM|nr:DNA mismatch repair endonuclease MutL [Solitalea canadensis]AFD09353.1 DNA mismatch repair protein MutL [Solitalea canadensis DSM 3403]